VVQQETNKRQEIPIQPQHELIAVTAEQKDIPTAAQKDISIATQKDISTAARKDKSTATQKNISTVTQKDIPNATQKQSLLIGTWLLEANDNFGEFMRQAGVQSEEFMKRFQVDRQTIRIKKLEEDNLWLYRIQALSTGIIEIKFKLGVEQHEMSPINVPGRTIYTLEDLNKLITDYYLYDGRHCQITREVDPAEPNVMILYGTIDKVLTKRTYRRLMT
jgi:hypothetical protein